jgi:hypothetical protein
VKELTMPRIDKWLYEDVQKHKRTAEFFEEAYGRKAFARAASRRDRSRDEREGGSRRAAAPQRRSERAGW